MKATITVEKCLAIASKQKYQVFSKPFQLNIWGVRSEDKNTAVFNDTCFIFYKNSKGIWVYNTFAITTDPSDFYLLKPINPLGTAIVKSGQYIDLWNFGFHKGRPDHKALVQVNPIKVYRDANLDAFKTFKEDSVDEGLFGINMHRASKNVITKWIGAYGAGCQVHADCIKYDNEFIPLVEQSVAYGNHHFSYTLLTENML